MTIILYRSFLFNTMPLIQSLPFEKKLVVGIGFIITPGKQIVVPGNTHTWVQYNMQNDGRTVGGWIKQSILLWQLLQNIDSLKALN